MRNTLFNVAVLVLLLFVSFIYSQEVLVLRMNAGSTTPVNDGTNNWTPEAYGIEGYATDKCDKINPNLFKSYENDFTQAAGALYCSERIGKFFKYSVPVKTDLLDAKYKIRLHFAEMYEPYFDFAQRVFRVTINGRVVLDNFDIFKEVGGFVTITKEFTDIVSDANQQIHIEFNAIIGEAKISALEVIRLSGTAKPQGIAAYYINYADTEIHGLKSNFPLRKPNYFFIEQEPFNKEQDYTKFRNSPWEFQYAVTFEFYLHITVAGEYGFSIDSNDGTILNIDNQVVIDNDGDHDAGQVVSGKKMLEVGDHKTILYFYQSVHRTGLKVWWQPPGTGEMVIMPITSMVYNPYENRPV